MSLWNLSPEHGQDLQLRVKGSFVKFSQTKYTGTSVVVGFVFRDCSSELLLLVKREHSWLIKLLELGMTASVLYIRNYNCFYPENMPNL